MKNVKINKESEDKSKKRILTLINTCCKILNVIDLQYPAWTGDFLFIMKEFKTIDEQINLLKTRKLIFEDEEKAKKTLLNNNYYNIINGYKELFIDLDNINRFKKGTRFEEIYALYEFDRQLRNIFLEYILKIENSLRTLIAYHFSEFHGNDNYLILENFDNYQSNSQVNEKIKYKQIKYIQNLIGNINKKIGNGVEETKYINHYLTKYGFIPLWVLVNILSFGDICTFLKLMKQNERVLVSTHFNIKEHDLTNLLGILNLTRNLCAHDERLYNYKFPTYGTINNNKYHKILNIDLKHGRYEKGKNDLFAVVLALKILLSKEDYSKFHSKIFSRFMSIQSKIKTVSLNEILEVMNFPFNWHDLLKMS